MGSQVGSQVGSIDPLAFLVGRVEVNVTEKGGVSKAIDLSKRIDRQKKTVRSTTDELTWDYERGLVSIDAPAAQGVTGFLSMAGTTTLHDISIESKMAYGSIVVVSMDDQPIATSRTLLLQVMSEDNNFGWSAPGKGLRRIAEVGGPPIVVKNLAGKVSFKRKDAASLVVTVLDFNGYETARSGPGKGAQDIALNPTTMYYIVRK